MYGFSTEQLAKAIQLNQDDRLFRVKTTLQPDPFVVHRFHGVETISAPYSFNVELFSTDARLELKQIVGQPMVLTMQTKLGPRHFHGYVREFARTGTDGGMAVYAAQVEPWFAFLQHASNCQIFQEKSVVDIVDEIFAKYASIATYRQELNVGNYPKLKYCVQYNESDFAFVSRLLEQAGIYYWFEHELDAHTMVLSDDSSKSPSLLGDPNVRYLTDQGSAEIGGIDTWDARRRIVTSLKILKSYDFKQPGSALLADRPLEAPKGALPDFESFVYDGAARYVDSAVGSALASLRAEEAAWQSKVFEGGGDNRYLSAGRHFTLEGHYDHLEDSEEDRQFFVLRVAHEARNNFKPDFSGVDESIYTNELACIRRKISFRPLRQTPLPRMGGPQTATVVGPPGEEIYDDRYGRVKVQFHWDRLGQHNESSSCWVRVANPWAGAGMGGVSAPRVGQEVVVDFLNGDPDRPLIVGRVYNEDNMPPFGTNVSGMKSKTVKGEGYNGLTMNDTDGSQALDMHAQKNMSTTVLNDQTNSVGNNRSTSVTTNDSLEVGADQSLKVTGSRSKEILGNETLDVTGNQDAKVIGNGTRKISGTAETTVTGAVTKTYESGQTLTITGGHTETITGDLGTTLTGAYTSLRDGVWSEHITNTSLWQVDALASEVYGSGRVVSVEGPDKRGVKGAVEDSNIGLRTVSVEGVFEHGVTETHSQFSSGVMNIGSAAMINLGVGEASGISIEGGKITISSDGSTIVVDGTGVTVNGAKIKLN